jgi:RimJ/RimL family protein N-acetyltransferase
MDVFLPEYDYLSASSPEWCKIALLPWDEEIFGFPVADFQLGPNPPRVQDLPLFVNTLEDYSARTRAKLVSAHTRGDDISAITLLERIGFSLVEFSLVATLSRLESELLPPSSQFAFRKALPEDHVSICQIAGAAFKFGRYHTDPRFPRDLANARYVQWMRNALSGSNPNNVVFVLGQPGEVVGFMDIVIRNGRADLRLGAVDPSKNTGFSGAGFSLYVESVRTVLGLGAKSVTTKIASANTRVMNVFSRLGFRFSKPEAVLHWRPLIDDIICSNATL